MVIKGKNISFKHIYELQIKILIKYKEIIHIKVKDIF